MIANTNSLSLANFVGIVVGFFNVLLPEVHHQRWHNKTIHFLTGEIRYG
jgi:hypothetical protein